MALRVLCVDDESAFVELTEQYLGREPDLEVETVTSPDEALDALAGDGVECVVSDYDMPGRDGIELLREVRAEHGDLPFILFTNKGDEQVASEAISAGVTDYLRKGGPERFDLLANRVRNAVDGYRAKRELERTREKLEELHLSARQLMAATDEETVYETAVASAEGILEFEVCGVYGVEDGWFVPLAGYDPTGDTDGGPGDADADDEDGDEDGNGNENGNLDQGILGRTYQTGESHLVEDARENEHAAPAEDRFRSAVSVPVGEDAVLQAIAAEPASYDEVDLELAELLAAHVTQALRRIRGTGA